MKLKAFHCEIQHAFHVILLYMLHFGTVGIYKLILERNSLRLLPILKAKVPLGLRLVMHICLLCL